MGEGIKEGIKKERAEAFRYNRGRSLLVRSGRKKTALEAFDALRRTLTLLGLRRVRVLSIFSPSRKKKSDVCATSEPNGKHNPTLPICYYELDVIMCRNCVK